MLEITLHLRTNEEVDIAAATLKKLFELRAQVPETATTHVHIEMTAEPEVAEVQAELTPPPAPAPVTLEQVRAKFAALSAAGKAAEAKALVAKFGATKLTEIGAEHYAALLAAAEEL